MAEGGHCGGIEGEDEVGIGCRLVGLDEAGACEVKEEGGRCKIDGWNQKLRGDILKMLYSEEDI